MVNEVDLDHQVVHIKSLGLPESKKGRATEDIADVSTREAVDVQDGQAGPSKARQSDDTVMPNTGEEHGSEEVANGEVTWDDTFETSLSPLLSEASISDLKKMYLEGPDPPRASDNGWMSRIHKKSEDIEVSEPDALAHQNDGVQSPDTKRGKHQSVRGGRGRQRGRGGRSQGSEREDHRKVLSEVRHPAGQFCHLSHKCSLSAQKRHGQPFIR